MSDKDDISGSIDASRPKEEALRLKTLAEEKYNSGDLNSAVAYAERARDLHPSVSGLRQMLTAFQILRAADAYPLPDDGGAEKQRPTPDYYKILQVQRFSHINSIKKQYKKLALTLHPDKNPFVASEEAFKLVGEAARVLSDKIRRKEYDLRLRIAMQSEAAGAVAVEIGEEGSRETFWTTCSACQLLHQFERKYLGHNLICPRCKKTFKAVEVEDRSNEDGGKNEKNDANTRVSARIQERVAKGGYVGSVEKFGLGAKRRNSNHGEVSERLVAKTARTGAVAERVDKSREGDDVENGRFKKMETLVNGSKEALGSGGVEIVENEASKGVVAGEDESMTLSQMQMLVKKKKKKIKKVVGGKLSMKAKEINAEKLKVSGMVDETEKDGARECGVENLSDEERVEEMEDVRGEEMEEGSGKEKVVNLRGNSNRRRVPKVRNLEAVHAASRSRIILEIEQDGSLYKSDCEVLPVEKEKEKEKENEMDVTRQKKRRRISKCGDSDLLNTNSSKDLEVVHSTSRNHLHLENEQDRSLEKGNSEVLLVEKEKEKEKEKEMDVTKEKKGRRRVPKKSGKLNTESSKNLEAVHAASRKHIDSEIGNDRSLEKGNSGILLLENEKEKERDVTREKKGRRGVPKNSDIVNTKSSKNPVDSDIQRLIANKKGDLEIMAVEDSDFHDFDKGRGERSFKKGQVWAVYDDVDAMPRHYALINEIVSVNPFEVTLSWLLPQHNEDDELISRLKKGFNVSCGIFQVTRKVTIRYLNLFSHLVDCERAARALYRIFPKKGSVWAVYSSSGREGDVRDDRIKDKRCYNIVICLSSHSDIHGLSIAYLEKVEGFRTVFKRREIGANAVVCLGAKDIKLFSHQIPAKKLSGEESSGLPKYCWELDPASLTPQLLTVS